MLRIGMLFIFQNLPYSFCACVRNTPKSVTFVIGKNLVSFSLFLDAPPPRPKMPFGQRHLAINIYNICKGHFGSRGGGGSIFKQTERHQFHLFNDKRYHFRCFSYACAVGIREGFGNEEHTYPLYFSTFTFLKIAMHLLKIWPKRHPG